MATADVQMCVLWARLARVVGRHAQALARAYREGGHARVDEALLPSAEEMGVTAGSLVVAPPFGVGKVLTLPREDGVVSVRLPFGLLYAHISTVWLRQRVVAMRELRIVCPPPRRAQLKHYIRQVAAHSQFALDLTIHQ